VCPFNGIWKTHAEEIIACAHAERYAEMRLPAYYELGISRKNMYFTVVYASFFEGSGDYYTHYCWLPSITYFDDLDSFNYNEESSFVEVLLHVTNLNDIDIPENSSRIKGIFEIYNQEGFNLWSDMSDVILDEIDESQVW